MINRILIRIKVVQTLYSYLLTFNDFTIEAKPARDTRDNRFAYKSYQQLLALIAKLSGQRLSPTDRISSDEAISVLSKTGQMLMSNNDVRSFLAGFDVPDNFVKLLVELKKNIIDSAAFKDFKRKKKKDLNDEIALWKTLLETVFAKDPAIVALFKQDSDFTTTGFNRGIAMAETTLDNAADAKISTGAAKISLEKSLEQSRLLYFALLRLIVEIARMREENIENAKEKYLPSADDLNPNLQLISSPVVRIIEQSPEVEAYFKAHPFSWENDYFLVKKLLDQILASKIYEEYSAIKRPSFEEDCEFWRAVFKDIILPSDELAEALEMKSVYWNDDLEIIGTFVMKTLRKWSNSSGNEVELLPKFKDEEDERFGDELLNDAIKNFDAYRSMVESFINENLWDPERLAFMDIVILTVAIAEIINFPKIPVAVSMNEYIEIANYYSTARSGQFINGVLLSIVNKLKAEGVIEKTLAAK